MNVALRYESTLRGKNDQRLAIEILKKDDELEELLSKRGSVQQAGQGVLIPWT